MDNKRMRFFIALLSMAVCIGWFFLPAAKAEGDKPGILDSGIWGNLQWELDNDGLLTITGEGDMDPFNDGVLSTDYRAWRSLNNRKKVKTAVIKEGVTSIGRYAFSLCTELESIQIPDTVTSIGENAFSSCYHMTAISIPNSVTEIGTSAFSLCESLKEVEIPSGIKNIRPKAFSWCKSLVSVRLPENLETIGNSAFEACSSLERISIPDGVESLGDFAFSVCDSLIRITIPDSVERIGEFTFYGCSSLSIARCSVKSYAWDYFKTKGFRKEADAPENTYIGRGSVIDVGKINDIEWMLKKDGSLTIFGFGKMDALMTPETEWRKYNAQNIRIINIHEGIENIGGRAFEWCRELTSITIPHSVTHIDEEAFYGCVSLKSILIPDSVQSIAPSAFYECVAIEEFAVEDSNEYFSSDDGILFNREKTEIIAFPAGRDWYWIPDNVKSIREGAFYGRRELISAIPPDGLKNIGNRSFQYCESMTFINIPDSVIDIGDNAFYNCSALTQITIPQSVKHIGDSAFMDCSALSRISFSEGIESIGVTAFSNCSSLISVWIPEGTVSIGDAAFSGCTSLKNITIPESVDQFGYRVFEDCPNLENIICIRDSYAWQAIAANGYADKLTEMKTATIIDSGTWGSLSWTLDLDGLLTISGEGDMDPFEEYSKQEWHRDNDKIKAIKIGDGITSIGDRAFIYCASVPSVRIPDSVTAIGKEAFMYCDALETITVPDSVLTIGQAAFEFCIGLTDAVLPNRIKVIENDLFTGCEKLTSLQLPDSVTTIGSSIVLHTALTEIRIPENVSRIKYDSFANTQLREINVAEANPFYASEQGVLFNKNKTTLIHYPRGKESEYTVPEGVLSIGYGAFMYNKKIESVTLPSSLKSIGEFAFSDCTNLKSINIPDSVTIIRDGAFADCESLSSAIRIPSGLEVLESSAFAGCKSIPVLMIPKGVKEVKRYAIKNMELFQSIYCVKDSYAWEQLMKEGFGSQLVEWNNPGDTGNTFIEDLSEGLMDRWLASTEDTSQMEIDQARNYLLKLVMYELDRVEAYADADIDDGVLKRYAQEYIKALQAQRASVTENAGKDDELFNDRWDEAYRSRAKLLFQIDDQFGLKISSEYNETLKDMVEKGRIWRMEDDLEESLSRQLREGKLIIFRKDNGRYETEAFELCNDTGHKVKKISISIDFLNEKDESIRTDIIYQYSGMSSWYKFTINPYELCIENFSGIRYLLDMTVETDAFTDNLQYIIVPEYQYSMKKDILTELPVKKEAGDSGESASAPEAVGTESPEEETTEETPALEDMDEPSGETVGEIVDTATPEPAVTEAQITATPEPTATEVWTTATPESTATEEQSTAMPEQAATEVQITATPEPEVVQETASAPVLQAGETEDCLYIMETDLTGDGAPERVELIRVSENEYTVKAFLITAAGNIELKLTDSLKKECLQLFSDSLMGVDSKLSAICFLMVMELENAE